MKAIIVIDVPNIAEPCEIDELGLVADMHIRATTMCRYPSFDLKEVDVRPVPEERELKSLEYLEHYRLEMTGKYEREAYSIGWNDCLREIEK